MPGKGFPPAPLETQLARGSKGAKQAEKAAPPRVNGVPVPPLPLSEQAMICWVSVSGLLFARGQLTLDSALSLTALCECYAQWVDLMYAVRRDGYTEEQYTITGSKTVVSASLKAFTTVDARFRAWLVEFGLTDASRGKVAGGVPPTDGADDPLSVYGLH